MNTFFGEPSALTAGSALIFPGRGTAAATGTLGTGLLVSTLIEESLLLAEVVLFMVLLIF
jgi:hypothetical protein